MTKLFQTLSLAAYRVVSATGFFDTRLGEKVFLAVYDAYKESIEARAADNLAQWVAPGTVAIDIGANVGFFTLRFAHWVGQNGRVLAIEPEAKNIRRLRQRIAENDCASHVVIIEGVAAEAPGTLHLALNPHHPADHRISTSGLTVRAWSIDEVLREAQWPRVSIIKIDVQGAEIRVLRGARKTIAQCSPVLFVEVDDVALHAAGFSAAQLFDEIESLGYSIYSPLEPFTPLTRAAVTAHSQTLGYGDYL